MSRIRHYSRIPLGQGNIIFRLFVSPSLSLSLPLLFFSLFSSPSISLSFDRLLRRRLSEFGRGEILFPSLTPPSCPANNYFPRRSLSNPISKLSIFGAVSISRRRAWWFFSWPSSPRIREYFPRKRVASSDLHDSPRGGQNMRDLQPRATLNRIIYIAFSVLF